jgi:hypothetical protein
MKLRRIPLVACGSVTLLAAFVGAVASCATNTNVEPTEEDAAVAIPPLPDREAPEASAPDAGCDASDRNCTTEVVSCATVSWCLVPTSVTASDMLNAIWGTSASDVWAVGSGGTILHYDGAAWTPTPSGVLNTFHAVWGSGPNDVWVVSSTGVLLRGSGFINGTTAWTNVPTSLNATLQLLVNAVWASSPEDVRIGGAPFNAAVGGRTTRCDQFVKAVLADGGAGWRPLPGAPTITGLWGSSSSDMWMTADNSATVPHERGLIFHGTPTDAGPDASPAADPLVWTPVDSQSVHRLEAVWGISANEVWAVGAQGTIRRFRAGDERWQPIDSPTKETLHGVWGSGPNDVWIVGDGGTVLHYDGTKVEASSAQLPLGRKPSLRGVWGSGPNDVWVVGDNAMLHYTGVK